MHSHAVCNASLAASHSSSALAIASTTWARVFDSSAARAGSRRKQVTVSKCHVKLVQLSREMRELGFSFGYAFAQGCR